MRKPRPSHLTLVPEAVKPKEHEGTDFESLHTDRTLFATKDPTFLIFCDFESITEAEFVSLLVSSEPRFIVDMRRAPRFDVGNLNRKLVFSIFANISARYFDMSSIGGLSGSSVDDASVMASSIRQQVFRNEKEVGGPILMLGETVHVQAPFMDELASKIDDLCKSGWRTVRVPAVPRERLPAGRSTIFISHAAPNDNEFARWLGAQLSLVGYDVWADFEMLRGGELFWDTIEDVIRNRAAKVVVAASRLAQTRSGVLDEVNLAISVERSQQLEGFVIPLKIDDLPYSEFRANLARKDILDFSENWGTGLAKLLKTLEDARVPRHPIDASTNMATIVHSRLSEESGLVNVPEPLLLNWLPITQMPASLNAFRLSAPAGKLQAISRSLSVPHVPHGDLILSHATLPRLRAALPPGISAQPHGSVLTSAFLRGETDQFSTIRRGEARRFLANIIRQGWEASVRAKGLEAFQLASGQLAWFFRHQQLSQNRVTFKDHAGNQRRKALVGFSPKRTVYWHFALEVRLAPGEPFHLIAKPHVIFSEDGTTPLESSSKMHVLRRGFCKSWWNDRWRDLLEAFLVELSGGTDAITLEMGSDKPLLVSRRMLEVECPVSPSADALVDDASGIDQLEEPEDTDPDEEELGFSAPSGSLPAEQDA